MTNETTAVNPVADTAVVSALDFNKPFSLASQLHVEKTEEVKGGKNSRVPVGSIDILLPTLADLGIEATIQEVDKESGFPKYADKVHNFLFDAVYNTVTRIMRNRLADKSIELKNPANPLPSNLTELFASANRSGAMIATNAFNKAFKEYVLTLGKSAEATTKILSFGLFNSKAGTGSENAALELAPIKDKEKFIPYVVGFAETDTAGLHTSYCEALLEIAQSTTDEATDF